MNDFHHFKFTKKQIHAILVLLHREVNELQGLHNGAVITWLNTLEPLENKFYYHLEQIEKNDAIKKSKRRKNAPQRFDK